MTYWRDVEASRPVAVGEVDVSVSHPGCAVLNAPMPIRLACDPSMVS